MSTTQRELVLVSHIAFLLDYSRRVAQRQVKQSDSVKLTTIRADVTEILSKKELNREEAKENGNS